MPTTKATHGPWTLGATRHEQNVGESWIVSVWAYEAPAGNRFAANAFALDRDDARARARLIAAAPAMLAALEEIVEWTPGLPNSYRLEDAQKIARNAIAQATE